jgi:hypothetical protein
LPAGYTTVTCVKTFLLQEAGIITFGASDLECGAETRQVGEQ